MSDFAYQPHPYGAAAPTRDTTAVMGRRILAWVLDLLIYIGLAVAVFAALAEYVEVPPGITSDACDILQTQDGDAASGCFHLNDRAYITSAGDNGIQALAALAYFSFFVLLQGITGGSPGKLLTGLRVVNARGERAGIGRSLVRSLLWVVDGAPWIAPLVGFIVGLTSNGHRRVGDMVADTYVVSKRGVGSPVTAPGVSPPPGQAWGAPAPPQAQAWPPQGPPSHGAPPPPQGAPPPPQGTAPGWSAPLPPTPTVPVPHEPNISGVPGDTPAPPSTAGISTPPAWEDQSPAQEPPPAEDQPTVESSFPTPESAAPADHRPPEVAENPEWWSGPESGADTSSPPEDPTVDPTVAISDLQSSEPETVVWADPSELPKTNEDWAPPSTPNADFDTAEHASPTAGPAPFVAPGTDPRAESPSTPQVNPTPPPQWDQARNTYIQWDPNQQMWLQWDTRANRWKIIDT